MKSNREIRKAVGGVLADKWFWRILAGGGALYAVNILAAGMLCETYKQLSIQTWMDFFVVKMAAMIRGTEYAVPSMQAAYWMTGATMFFYSVIYLFAAICLFGIAGLSLKAVRDDKSDWFAVSLGGFKRPFELLWLIVLINLKVFLWALLFIIPGIIAAYRYRQAWYLKCEHPDWAAARCLDESCAMMRGHKWQAFCLDFGYGVQLSIASIFVTVLPVLRNLGKVPAIPSMCVEALAFLWMVRTICRFVAARAVFFREMEEQNNS